MWSAFFRTAEHLREPLRVGRIRKSHEYCVSDYVFGSQRTVSHRILKLPRSSHERPSVRNKISSVPSLLNERVLQIFATCRGCSAIWPSFFKATESLISPASGLRLKNYECINNQFILQPFFLLPISPMATSVAALRRNSYAQRLYCTITSHSDFLAKINCSLLRIAFYRLFVICYLLLE